MKIKKKGFSAKAKSNHPWRKPSSGKRKGSSFRGMLSAERGGHRS